MVKGKLTWAIVIFSLSTLACSLLGGGANESASSTVSLGQDEAAQAPAPVEPPVVEEVEAVVAEEPEPGPAEPSSIAFTGVTGLDQLSSYRVTFVMDFDGTSGGQPSVGRIEMMLENTIEPAAKHLQLQMEGTTVQSSGGFNRAEFYEVGNKVYMYSEAAGTGQWIAMESGPETADAFSEGFFAPDEELELPETVQCDVESDTVNGVVATHCTFSEADVDSDEATYDSLTGHVWVSEDGYIVKYTLEAKGFRSLEDGEGLFDFGDVGFQYDLTDVNANFSITPPEEALNTPSFDFGSGGQDESGTDDGVESSVPVTADATEVFSVGGVTSFYTQSDVTTVIDFYRTELATQGWAENADSAYSDENAGLLAFEKDGGYLTIAINKEGEGRINVNIIEQ